MAEANFVAGGTITPSTFVNITGNNQVAGATGTSTYIAGVAQEWSSLAPIPGAASTIASGDPIKVYGPGEICLLAATSAGWTAGNLLTSDGSGNGVAATSNQYVGAVALTTVTGAGLGRVQVIFGPNT